MEVYAPGISAGQSAVVCNNSGITLSATGSGITWYKDGVAAGSGNTLYVTGAGNYTAKAASNCGISPVSNTIAVYNGFSPAPPVVTVNGNTAICSGGSVLLTASGTGITWYRNGVLTASGDSLTITQAGNYSAVATNDCGTSSPSAQVSVTTDTPPQVPTITAVLESASCVGSGHSLTASGNNITWFFNGSQIGLGNTISVTADGVYTARSMNNCGTTSALEGNVIQKLEI